jgi:myo-inositol-1(or 4)-monophosphatase
VDPVDGTTNLAAGLPLVTTSIALARNGVVELGLVFDPSRNELFAARRGRGATLNGRPIHSGARGGKLALRDAVLCVGSPPKSSAFVTNLGVIAGIGPKVQSARPVALGGDPSFRVTKKVRETPHS